MPDKFKKTFVIICALMLLCLGFAVVEQKWANLLVDACRNEDYEKVERLASYSFVFDIDQPGGDSVLFLWITDMVSYNATMVAIDKGDDLLLKILLSHGADPNKNCPGLYYPPLECALLYAPSESVCTCANMLLDYGADANNHPDDSSVLLDSIVYPYTTIGDYLPAAERDGVELYKRIENMVTEKWPTDEFGEDPLFHAIYYGNESLADYLQNNSRSNINVRNSDGETVLLRIAKEVNSHKLTKCQINAVNYFVAHEGDINLKDEDGFTALDYAHQKGNQELIELLE